MPHSDNEPMNDSNEDSLVLKAMKIWAETNQRLVEKFTESIERITYNIHSGPHVNNALPASSSKHTSVKNEKKSVTHSSTKDSSAPRKLKRQLPPFEGHIVYDPWTFSEEVIDKINSHNTSRNPFNPETTDLRILPINEERTNFAVFALINPKEGVTQSNCKPCYSGYVIRCFMDNRRGCCHGCAGVVARMHANPDSREQHFTLKEKDGETNGCIIKATDVISNDPTGATPVKKLKTLKNVKTEKAEKSDKTEKTTKTEKPEKPEKTTKTEKSEKKTSQGHQLIDGMDDEDAVKGRKWSLWKSVKELGGDNAPTGKPCSFLYEKTDKGKVYLAIAQQSSVFNPSESVFPKSQILSTRATEYIDTNGKAVPCNMRTFLFRPSLVLEASKHFDLVDGERLYQGVLSDEFFTKK